MQNFISLLDSYKLKRVKSQQALQESYPLFYQSINEKHSQQYFLLKTKYEGLYEKICKECYKLNQTLRIFFYINQQDFQFYYYVEQTQAPAQIYYLPLNQLQKLPKQYKTIYKVIYNQTKLDQGRSSILLLPNDNIIQGRFTMTGIPILIPSKIYYNGNNWFELNYIIDKHCANTNELIKQSYYLGEINDRLNPINEGFFQNPSFRIDAKFQDGFFKSPIQITFITENINKTINRNNQKTLLPICYQKDNLIDFFTFQTIFEGRWINQKVMDYYLQYASSEIMRYNKCVVEKKKYKNYLINSCDCADIFSSDIFEQQYYSEDQWKSYQKIYNIDILNEKNRFIFALNIGKSHFIVLILEQYEQNTGMIYLLDSIPNDFNKTQQKIGITNINSLFPHLKIHQEIIRVMPIAHQKNGFDCGIHCIYNSLLVLREENKEINKISFIIDDRQKISKLRRHIYFTMVNNYSHWLNY